MKHYVLLMLSTLLVVACQPDTGDDGAASAFEQLGGDTDTLGIAAARGRTVDTLDLIQINDILTHPEKPIVLLYWRAGEPQSLATLATLTQASNMPSQGGHRYVSVQVDQEVPRSVVDAQIRANNVWFEAYQLRDTTTGWSYELQPGWDGSTPTTAVTRPGMEPLYYTGRAFGDTLEVAAVLSFLESPATQ